MKGTSEENVFSHTKIQIMIYFRQNTVRIRFSANTDNKMKQSGIDGNLYIAID